MPIIGPLSAIVIGFLVAFFFHNTIVFILTGIIMIAIILAVICMTEEGLTGILRIVAIVSLVFILVVMWITTISVNHWWAYIVPTQLLR